MKLKRRIFFIVNVDWFFLSHRLPLALAAIKQGYDIYLITRDTGQRSNIEKQGINFISIPFDRSGMNPVKDLCLIFKICRLIKRHRPDIIHNVTIKPAAYGTIAAKFAGESPKVINAISGLGYNFIDGRNGPVQTLLNSFLSYAFRGGVTFIFQNDDDRLVYSRKGLLEKNEYRIIKGSGVDAASFKFQPPVQKGYLIVGLTARLLFDKGIIEFIEAAQQLEGKWKGKAKFVIAGNEDPNNKACISVAQLQKMLIPGYIEWVGFQDDIQSFLVQSDIICLPSYREGLPKSLVEAMAVGRPIVTTDVPGCRECVENRVNGYLVPVKNSSALADAIQSLLLDEGTRLEMGKASRRKMEAELSLDQVIKETLDIYTQSNKLV